MREILFSVLSVVQGGPITGVPFLAAQPLKVQPTEEDDALDPTMVVQRLNAVRLPDPTSADTACDLGGNADRNECLAKESCMWVNLGGVNQYCSPCEIEGKEIPCWNTGAIVSGLQVKECAMKCSHQKVIRQPEYACIDETGFITESECFDKGVASGSRCMFVSYEDGGVKKSSCAPCELAGVGGWDCPAVDGPGPGFNTKVTGCSSMCVAPPPTPPPPPPPGQNSPGIVRTTLPKNQMVDAPFPVPPPAPPTAAEIVAAATAAAEVAGPTEPPPDVYYPVIMYRKPKEYLANAPGLR